MCFSVNVNLVKEELEERYGVNFPDEYRYEPSYYYHAFGMPLIPAVCSETPETFRLLKWGLIPHWTKNEEEANEIRIKTFNARAESIDTKPSFASSFKGKRCLIPVRGFYEWQHVGKKKIPWYVYRKDNDIMTLAGLYSIWNTEPGADPLYTFTIITTGANELMTEVHNSKQRMPVILEKQNEDKWLNLRLPREEAHSLLKPCSSEILKAHTISPLINDRNADKNNPELIREYSWADENTLF